MMNLRRQRHVDIADYLPAAVVGAMSVRISQAATSASTAPGPEPLRRSRGASLNSTFVSVDGNETVLE